MKLKWPHINDSCNSFNYDKGKRDRKLRILTGSWRDVTSLKVADLDKLREPEGFLTIIMLTDREEGFQTLVWFHLITLPPLTIIFEIVILRARFK